MIDLICNTCGHKSKGEAEDIGQDCPKCEDGSLIDGSAEDAEGAKPEKPKGTEKGGETKITKEEECINNVSSKLIELVQEEDMFEFKKEFSKFLKEAIVKKINDMKVELMESYSDKEPKAIDEELKVGSMGVLDDGSDFSVTAMTENDITLLVGGKEMTMSMDEFNSKAKVNTSI